MLRLSILLVLALSPVPSLAEWRPPATSRTKPGAVHSPDPNKRMLRLINQSEDLKAIQGEWERFWMIDQPGEEGWFFKRPERVHGGVGIGSIY